MLRKGKLTVSVDETLAAEVKRLVGKGGSHSLSACVNEPLRMLLERERRARLERAMEKASRDRMFLADIRETMKDFRYVDAETARRMEGR